MSCASRTADAPTAGRRVWTLEPSVSRHDAEHLAVVGCERNAPIRRVQRTVGAHHESVREAGEPGQHLRPLTGLAIEADEVGAVGRPLIVVGEDLDAIEFVAMPRQADGRNPRAGRWSKRA